MNEQNPRPVPHPPLSGIDLTIHPNFNSFAAAHPWIGEQTGDIGAVPGGGYAQEFQNATVYEPPNGEPHEVHGAILAKYAQLNWYGGILGWPITDETATPDGQGRFNHFQRGAIYWHPAIGAFEVHGAIGAKWAALGWEGQNYPTTDETATPDGLGRFNHFRTFQPDGSTADSSIYWTADTGAFEVHGAIRDAWSGSGWEAGFLGYPLSDEHDFNGGRQSDFQNGGIFWTAADGAKLKPQWFVVGRPSITFGTGISVGGYGWLTIFSDGTTHFQGHLHDSGFPSYDCLAVFTVKDADGRAYAASHSGRVHGTDEPGSRDLDWNDWGTDDDIRHNWPKIRDGGLGGSQVNVTSDWSPQKIAEDVAAVVGVILSLIPLIFSGGGSNKSSNTAYGQPGNDPAGGLPPPDQAVGSGVVMG